MTTEQLTMMVATPAGLDPRELAWAAGLFEGEGTIRINKATGRNRGGVLHCSVVNTDRSVVEFFQDRWPGYCKAVRPVPGHKQAWVWTVAARKAERFIRDLLPYLFTERMWTKAQWGLTYQDTKQVGRRRLRAEEVDDYLALQEHFYSVMCDLNRRGIAV